jgi:DnaJ-class molecular chaperone
MSNEFDCHDCEGSGQKENPKNSVGFTFKWIPCPTCLGSGKLALAVEFTCLACNNGTIDRGEWTDKCGYCKGTGTDYRPLTDEETHALFNSTMLIEEKSDRMRKYFDKRSKEWWLEQIRTGHTLYRGAPVKLVAKG